MARFYPLDGQYSKHIPISENSRTLQIRAEKMHKLGQRQFLSLSPTDSMNKKDSFEMLRKSPKPQRTHPYLHALQERSLSSTNATFYEYFHSRPPKRFTYFDRCT
jgi:hypothetical protein